VVRGATTILAELALRLYRLRVGSAPVSNIAEERLGGGIWKQIPIPSGATRLWIHAASVGEVRGILPLIDVLKKQYSVEIIGSTTSATGREEFRKVIPQTGILPFDACSVLRPVFERIRPSALVINETELWPALIQVADELQIPILLCNGRISDRSFPRYRRIRRLTKQLLGKIARVLTQTERDRQRFIALGADPQRVTVSGSTKYDIADMRLSHGQRHTLKESLGLQSMQPCIVAGSVREGEFEQVISAYVVALKEVPSLQLIIAPRHPQYFEAVAAELTRQNLSFNRRSLAVAPTAVLLVDTLGELTEMYRAADFAFIGGTLVPVGGHNPLEAAAAGLPILFGKYTENVREIAQQLVESGAAKRVGDEAELAQHCIHWALELESRNAAALAGVAVCAEHRGAVERLVSEIAALVSLPQRLQRTAQA
jgi:3-deoxy-D-manno-octulosonic-acid transferase